MTSARGAIPPAVLNAGRRRASNLPALDDHRRSRAGRRPPVLDHLASCEPAGRWMSSTMPPSRGVAGVASPLTCGYAAGGMGGTSPAGRHRTPGRTVASDPSTHKRRVPVPRTRGRMGPNRWFDGGEWSRWRAVKERA